MDSDNEIFTIERAREIDMVSYLSSLGFEPTKVRGTDYWYHSPLRDEKEPSFKVNRKLNAWYDHGLGKGGGVIDFGLVYHNCMIADLLAVLGGASLPIVPLNVLKSNYRDAPKIKIIEALPLGSLVLLNYLHHRKIPLEIASLFCREVRYSLHEKNYYGIGFKNDLGGYEIRNPYFKTSCSPKGITTIDNHCSQVMVFEGFMDFLSFKANEKNRPEAVHDYVILNSVSFFQRARPFMENHQHIRLFLDHDVTGRSYTAHALSISPKYTDASSFYNRHKDLNDWLINGRTSKKKHLGPRL